MRNSQLFLFLFMLLFMQSLFAQTPVREKISINEGWKFSLSDSVKYCYNEFDDNLWRSIDLPHDWSVESSFSREYSGRNAWLPGGVGWYRKTLVIPDEYSGKSIEIQFDGVYKNAFLWINEHPVGIQHDGYTSFRYDITELLNVGEENVISMRVDNSIQPNCRWYSGSGIYRNAWLNIRNETYIDTWGTYITTPIISDKETIVNIRATIYNIDETKNVTVSNDIYNEFGQKVSSKSSEFKIGNYRNIDFSQELIVNDPIFWTLEKPFMYKVITSIKANGVLVDEYESKFGIRSLKFDADKGFFLNGINTKMKGVCLHHEAGPLGAAVPEEVWLRRLRKLKEVGCNAIRTAHNPPSPEFLNMCDSLGFLIMDEFVDKWENPILKSKKQMNPFYDVPFADPDFSVEWRKNYSETIKRDRNHPSIIIWSVGNENHPPGTNEQKSGLRNIAGFARSIDPTRPVISGMERGKDKPVDEKVSDIIESCKYMDLIALNYGEQWCKLIHDRKPGKPYVSTESYTYFNSELEKRFANIERSPWIDVLENENNLGLFLWVGIDYLGESKKWGSIGSNSGLLDLAGFRKSSSYLYEALWSEKPMVHIEVYNGDADDFSTSGRWGWPPMEVNWNHEKGKELDVVTYTNCEAVDLYLNDKKIGRQQLNDFPNWIMKWKDLDFQSGELKAVGIINNKEVCEFKISTTGKVRRLNVVSDVAEIKPGGVFHIEVDLLDSKGNIVLDDIRNLSFSVEGDAEIIGLTNGSMNDLTPFSNKTTRDTYLGKCLCIVKCGKNEGIVKISVASENLKTKIAEVKVGK